MYSRGELNLEDSGKYLFLMVMSRADVSSWLFKVSHACVCMQVAVCTMYMEARDPPGVSFLRGSLLCCFFF